MTITTNNRTYPIDTIGEIVTNQLRVSIEDGELYDSAVRCTKNAIDAAEDYTNRVICRSEVIVDGTVEPGRRVDLMIPCLRVDTIKVDDTEIDSSAYVVSSNVKTSSLEFLTTYTEGHPLSIEGTGGYEDGEIPGGIYQAVAIIASSFFERGAEAEMPNAAKSLLNPYRIYPYEL